MAVPDLVVLHTNDLHGKLTESTSAQIVSERDATPNSILLDAGDAISSGNAFYRLGGEPILARMSEMGYDAMAMGNREFHFLKAGLHSKASLARFPILSANLHGTPDDDQLPTQPCVILTVGTLKVAVFGLTVRMITKKMLISKISPYWFTSPFETAAEIVPQLREEADLVIALTHIGLQRDQELAETVPGIDLIVGGHTHAVLHEPRVVGSTSIVQTGSWARHLGRTEIFRNQDGSFQISGSLIDLSVQA